MSSKSKNTKTTSESIKSGLNIILDLNKQRKSALDKISKSILEDENKTEDNKHKLSK